MTADTLALRPEGTAPATPAASGWARLAPAAVPLAAIAAAWLAIHDYVGAIHDATFYMVLALHWLAPEAYSRDLFFAYGSQGDFTLFTPLFAPVVGALGQSGAALAATAVGQAIWVAGAVALVARMAGSVRAAVLPLLFVVSLDSVYGGYSLLHYGEGFPTPRLFAEALTLWGLWALAGRRYVLAFAPLMAAAALHPLMAAYGIAAAVVFLVLADRRWALLPAAGIVGCVALAFLGVAPFDRLLHRMDPEWFALVESRNVYLFPSLWEPPDWYRLVLATSYAMAGALALDGWQRRLVLATVITGLGGVAATILGADLAHNVFFIQVQLYRAVWLVQLFANIGAGFLILRLWQQRSNAAVLTALLALGWVTTFMLIPGLGVALALIAAFVSAFQILRRPPPASRLLTRTVVGLAVVVVGVAFAIRVYIAGHRAIEAARTAAAPPDFYIYAMPIDIAVLAAVLFVFARAYPRAARQATPVAAGLALVLAAATWDHRTEWVRGTQGGFDVAQLQRLIPKDATVYFEQDVRGTWNMLGRATYGSIWQGGGIAFSRETAFAYREAVQHLTPVMGREALDIFRRDDDESELPTLARADIVGVCKSAPGLDFMVLSRKVDGLYVAEWSPSSPKYDLRGLARGAPQPPITTYYLYDCRGLRGPLSLRRAPRARPRG